MSENVVIEIPPKKLSKLDSEIQSAKVKVAIASLQARYPRKIASTLIYSDLLLGIFFVTLIGKLMIETKSYYPLVPAGIEDDNFYGTPLSVRYLMMAVFISGNYFILSGLWLMCVIRKGSSGIFYWFMINCFLLGLCFSTLLIIPFTSLGLQGGFYSLFGVFGLQIRSSQIFKVYDYDRAIESQRRENINRKSLIKDFNQMVNKSNDSTTK